MVDTVLTDKDIILRIKALDRECLRILARKLGMEKESRSKMQAIRKVENYVRRRFFSPKPAHILEAILLNPDHKKIAEDFLNTISLLEELEENRLREMARHLEIKAEDSDEKNDLIIKITIHAEYQEIEGFLNAEPKASRGYVYAIGSVFIFGILSALIFNILGHDFKSVADWLSDFAKEHFTDNNPRGKLIFIICFFGSIASIFGAALSFLSRDDVVNWFRRYFSINTISLLLIAIFFFCYRKMTPSAFWETLFGTVGSIGSIVSVIYFFFPEPTVTKLRNWWKAKHRVISSLVIIVQLAILIWVALFMKDESVKHVSLNGLFQFEGQIPKKEATIWLNGSKTRTEKDGRFTLDLPEKHLEEEKSFVFRIEYLRKTYQRHIQPSDLRKDVRINIVEMLAGTWMCHMENGNHEKWIIADENDNSLPIEMELDGDLVEAKGEYTPDTGLFRFSLDVTEEENEAWDGEGRININGEEIRGKWYEPPENFTLKQISGK